MRAAIAGSASSDRRLPNAEVVVHQEPRPRWSPPTAAATTGIRMRRPRSDSRTTRPAGHQHHVGRGSRSGRWWAAAGRSGSGGAPRGGRRDRGRPAVRSPSAPLGRPPTKSGIGPARATHATGSPSTWMPTKEDGVSPRPSAARGRPEKKMLDGTTSMRQVGAIERLLSAEREWPGAADDRPRRVRRCGPVPVSAAGEGVERRHGRSSWCFRRWPATPDSQ
jgi:hypothetical protein